MVKQWQIYFLNLNPVKGSEQAGTRPCIVVSFLLLSSSSEFCVIMATLGFRL